MSNIHSKYLMFVTIRLFVLIFLQIMITKMERDLCLLRKKRRVVVGSVGTDDSWKSVVVKN